MMIDEAYQACTVEATYGTEQARPRRFTLDGEGEQLNITELGRRWKDDEGWHCLARVSDGRVFELVHTPSGWFAQLKSKPPNFA